LYDDIDDLILHAIGRVIMSKSGYLQNKMKKHLALKIALGIAILAIIILSILLIQQYRNIQNLNYISMHRQSFLRSLHGSGQLTSANASSTQSWMTFDYINRAFALPPTYLETAIGITDSRYPRLTISGYAKDAGLSDAAALAKVQDAIRGYSGAKQ